MKRTPLKRTKPKRKLISFDDLFSLYLSIWNIRRHYCESCGCYLGSEPRSYMFDHLLEKSKYPDLATDPDNIALVCWDCHSLKTAGHPTEKHQEAILIYKQNIGI